MSLGVWIFILWRDCSIYNYMTNSIVEDAVTMWLYLVWPIYILDKLSIHVFSIYE